jgi:hypothetical protein
VLDEVALAVECRADASATPRAIEEQTMHSLHARLGIRFRLTCQDAGALVRYEGKAQRVLVQV